MKINNYIPQQSFEMTNNGHEVIIAQASEADEAALATKTGFTIESKKLKEDNTPQHKLQADTNNNIIAAIKNNTYKINLDLTAQKIAEELC